MTPTRKKRKPLSESDLMRVRRKGAGDLKRLIAAATPPEYAIVSPTFLSVGGMPAKIVHCQTWNETTGRAMPNILQWSGIPNEAMTPVNDTAKAIFDAWRRSIANSAVGYEILRRHPKRRGK